LSRSSRKRSKSIRKSARSREERLRIHEVIIYPGAGHVGNGVYDRGRVHGAYAEVDLIDRYARALAEELDNSAIRHRVAPTRKAPGQSREAFAASVFPNTLVIECRIGEAKTTTISNSAAIRVNENISVNMAKNLLDVIAHWGNLYGLGHQTAKPKSLEVKTQENVGWIVLEPYLINGTKVEDYAKWSHKLGYDLGRFLSDYVRRSGESAGIQIQGYMRPRARNG